MITVGAARSLAERLLAAAGMPARPAHRSAELLVLADLWGVGSHGLFRLPYYLRRLQAGGITADADLAVVRDTGSVVALDGGNGLGHWQVWDAARQATERAARHGIAAASVGNSSHCGCLGLYTTPGLRRGLVTMVFSTGPAVMPAPGTGTPVLSTSPLAAGIPGPSQPAIIDLAMSAVARGKIGAHARRGEPLPPGWAVDHDGRPVTDPAAALRALLAPVGGGKGFALAFLVEALAAAAVGPSLAVKIPDMFADDSAHRQQGIGHLVISVDPGLLDVDGEGPARMNQLTEQVTSAGGHVPGSGRTMPWDVDDDLQVEISPEILAELEDWSDRLTTSVRGQVI